MTFRPFVDARVRLVIYRFFDVVKKRCDYAQECKSYIDKALYAFLCESVQRSNRFHEALRNIHAHSRSNHNPNSPKILDLLHPNRQELWASFAAYITHILVQSDFESLPRLGASPSFWLLCQMILADGIKRKNFALVVEPEFVSTFQHFKQGDIPQIIWSSALDVLNEAARIKDEGTRLLSNTSNRDPSDLTTFFDEFFEDDKDLKMLKKRAWDQYHLKPHQVMIVAVDPTECCRYLLAGFRVAQISSPNPEDPEDLKKKVRKHDHHRIRIRSISDLRLKPSNFRNQAEQDQQDQQQPVNGLSYNKAYQDGS